MGTLYLRMGLFTGSILVCLSIFLSGCASQEEKKPQTVDRIKEWQTRAEKSVSLTPVPSIKDLDDSSVLEDMTESLETNKSPSNQTPMDSKKLPSMPVTMKMHDISLPVLIRTLARVANLDIIINDSIKGQTKIAITDIPWDQAFMGILDTFALTYEWSGEILRVVSVEDLKRKQDLMEARQNYQKTKKQYDLALMQLTQKEKKLEPLVTKIVEVHYADLLSLKKNLTRYLSTQKKMALAAESGEISMKNGSRDPVDLQGSSEMDLQGSILVDEFSNSLILHISRADLKKIMPIIRQLDQPIKQVRIEAHIVEAGSTTGKELGIQWGGLGTATTDGGKSLSIGGNMTEFNNTLEQGHTPTDGNIVNLPIEAATGMTLGVMAQKVGEYVLYAQLQALEKEGMLNILSNPSITTLDHRQAVIKSGKEVPFQTVVNEEVNIEWKEAVIKLEVTPHIINDTIVRLEIVTHKDELDFTDDVRGNPTIITKNAQTNVMLFDGQTTVIGGLNKERRSDGEGGVPGLKDIPGLGWFFKSMTTGEEMEELLIFITPHILKEQTVVPRGE